MEEPGKQKQGNMALRDEVADAEVLLAYAASRGIVLPSDVVTTLVKSRALLGGDLDDPASFEQQALFWNAREKLAEAVRPVTIASLKATTQTHGRGGWWGNLLDRLVGEKRFSRAERAVHLFRAWAFWALLGLLVVQVYWIVGYSVTADIKPLLVRVEENQRKQEQEQDKQARLRERAANAAEAADSHDMQKLEAEAQAFEQQMLVRYQILQDWNDFWRWPLEAMDVIQTQADKAAPAGNYERLQTAMLTAEFASHGLERYVLPLLYGFLGACLYVLRTLANDIKTLAYTPEQNTLYRLRVYMGTLSGLVVIWFVPAIETEVGLKSLTPFALAFLVGYSVDLLFALLDKLIAVFSGK